MWSIMKYQPYVNSSGEIPPQHGELPFDPAILTFDNETLEIKENVRFFLIKDLKAELWLCYWFSYAHFCFVCKLTFSSRRGFGHHSLDHGLQIYYDYIRRTEIELGPHPEIMDRQKIYLLCFPDFHPWYTGQTNRRLDPNQLIQLPLPPPQQQPSQEPQQQPLILPSLRQTLHKMEVERLKRKLQRSKEQLALNRLLSIRSYQAHVSQIVMNQPPLSPLPVTNSRPTSSQPVNLQGAGSNTREKTTLTSQGPGSKGTQPDQINPPTLSSLPIMNSKQGTHSSETSVQSPDCTNAKVEVVVNVDPADVLTDEAEDEPVLDPQVKDEPVDDQEPQKEFDITQYELVNDLERKAESGKVLVMNLQIKDKPQAQPQDESQQRDQPEPRDELMADQPDDDSEGELVIDLQRQDESDNESVADVHVEDAPQDVTIVHQKMTIKPSGAASVHQQLKTNSGAAIGHHEQMRPKVNTITSLFQQRKNNAENFVPLHQQMKNNLQAGASMGLQQQVRSNSCHVGGLHQQLGSNPRTPLSLHHQMKNLGASMGPHQQTRSNAVNVMELHDRSRSNLGAPLGLHQLTNKPGAERGLLQQLRIKPRDLMELQQAEAKPIDELPLDLRVKIKPYTEEEVVVLHHEVKVAPNGNQSNPRVKGSSLGRFSARARKYLVEYISKGKRHITKEDLAMLMINTGLDSVRIIRWIKKHQDGNTLDKLQRTGGTFLR